MAKPELCRWCRQCGPLCDCDCHAYRRFYNAGVSDERERRDKAIDAEIAEHSGATREVFAGRVRDNRTSYDRVARVLLAILEPGDEPREPERRT